MKKTALITSLIFLFNSLFSQITFVKGYLITLDNDTLQGEIKMNPKKKFDLFHKVFFKDNSGVQKNYKPEKVKGYGFEENNFITSTYEKEPAFYKILSNGELMLYEIMYETMVMNEISYKSEYYIAHKEDNEYAKLKQNKYKKQLSELMKDNPDIVENADDEKKFEIEKVAELVNHYNDWAKTK